LDRKILEIGLDQTGKDRTFGLVALSFDQLQLQLPEIMNYMQPVYYLASNIPTS